MVKIGLNRCPYCGDDEVYRSRREPLIWLERACGLFLLQLVRCVYCEQRHYRPILFPRRNILTRSFPERNALRRTHLMINGNARHSRTTQGDSP